jgi:hypothetical protein
MATQKNAAQRKSPVFMRLLETKGEQGQRKLTHPMESSTDTATDTRFDSISFRQTE